MSAHREFSPELQEGIVWFRLAWRTLPRQPFTLRPGHRVTDTDRFYAALDQDIRAGPTGVRARTPALQQDLADLLRQVEPILRDCEHDMDAPATLQPIPLLLLTQEQAAGALNISERKFWDIVDAGEIPRVSIGRAVRFRPADLQAWIDAQVARETK